MLFPIWAQSLFQGKIKANYEANGEIVNFVYWLSPTQTALEMAFQIKGETYKGWMQFDVAQQNLVMTGLAPDGKKDKKHFPIATLTSKYNYQNAIINYSIAPEQQNIAGYACQVYTFRWEGYKMQVSLANSLLTNTEDLMYYLKDDLALHILHKEKIQGFPLKTILWDDKGTILYQFEAKEVIPQTLTATDFVF